jgi:hypothetical protein
MWTLRAPGAVLALLIVAAGCGAAGEAPAGDGAGAGAPIKKKALLSKPNELELTTERVIVFKDGYCLFVKRARGTTNARGELFTEEVPDAAVLGSFWATPSKGRLLSMDAGVITTTEKEDESVTCSGHLDLLRANKGKMCTIKTTEAALLTGTIREVLTRKAETALPVPLSMRPLAGWSSRVYRSARPSVPVSARRIASVVSGSHFVLTTKGGDVVLGVNQIRQLTIKGMKLKIERTVTTTRTAKRLTFRFAKGGEKREMLITYFCPGIRWIPTYRVELARGDAKKKLARITLQAEILNEAEDLDAVPLDLVVGVPNFRFKSVVSPFSLESTLRNALQQAAPQLMGQFRNDFSNALFSQRGGERRRPVHGASRLPTGGSVSLPAELTTAGTQDLFIYSLPKMPLKKGHRAAVTIFNATAPYRDVYTWRVHLQRHDIAAAPSGAGVASPLVLSKNQIWHQVELTNNTKLPWTTGAAMFMQDGRPLAQELLTYTSPGDAVRVPVTVSVDTRGSYHEKETGRKLKALRWSHRDYARIDKQGNLTVTNSKKTAVNVEVTCLFGGRADKASNGGKIILGAFDSKDWKNYNGHPAVNNHSTVTWRLKLKPGKTIDLNVKYHYFTRQW